MLTRPRASVRALARNPFGPVITHSWPMIGFFASSSSTARTVGTITVCHCPGTTSKGTPCHFNSLIRLPSPGASWSLPSYLNLVQRTRGRLVLARKTYWSCAEVTCAQRSTSHELQSKERAGPTGGIVRRQSVRYGTSEHRRAGVERNALGIVVACENSRLRPLSRG